MQICNNCEHMCFIALCTKRVVAMGALYLIRVYYNWCIFGHNSKRDATFCPDCCIPCLHFIYRCGVIKTLVFSFYFYKNFFPIIIWIMFQAHEKALAGVGRSLGVQVRGGCSGCAVLIDITEYFILVILFNAQVAFGDGKG